MKFMKVILKLLKPLLKVLLALGIGSALVEQISEWIANAEA